jgi:hypothetical protein
MLFDETIPTDHLVLRDTYNLLASLRLDELNGKTPTEWLLEASFLKNSALNLLTNCIET